MKTLGEREAAIEDEEEGEEGEEGEIRASLSRLRAWLLPHWPAP